VARLPIEPVGDCTLRSLVLEPASIAVVAGRLAADVQVTAVLQGGLCAVDWEARYTPGTTPAPALQLSRDALTYTGIIPGGTSAGAREDWPTPPSSREVTLVPTAGAAPPAGNTAALQLDLPPVTPTTQPTTTTPATTSTTAAPTTTTRPATTTTTRPSQCALTDYNPKFDRNAELDEGRLEQQLRLVMQPTTKDHFCRFLALRFTTSDEVVQIPAAGEGQRMTGTIPKGFGPFAEGTKYVVDIIDTSAGNVRIGGSEFTT
jgi:hypothetical protein